MITSRNLAFSRRGPDCGWPGLLGCWLRLGHMSSLPLRLKRSALLAPELQEVCSDSPLISRALLSVRNAGHSLLVAGCAPSEFRHLGDSLFRQSSCLWVPEQKGQISSVARQVRAPWPNCWHLKQRLGRGMYFSTSNLSKPRKMCSGRVGASKVRKKVPVCTFLPPLVIVTLLASFTWGWSRLRLDMLRSLARSSLVRSWAAWRNLTPPLA